MSTRTRAVGLGLWLAVITGLVAQDPSLKTPDAFPRFPPVAPADVGKTFVVQHGFEMQLIAAEPLVTDPVAMAIDENGGAFVVEMNDYPYTDPKRTRLGKTTPPTRQLDAFVGWRMGITTVDLTGVSCSPKDCHGPVASRAIVAESS